MFPYYSILLHRVNTIYTAIWRYVEAVSEGQNELLLGGRRHLDDPDNTRRPREVNGSLQDQF
jgi:hypothetical protein